MSWLIRHNGVEFSSDDFLIEDLQTIEESTGTPWSIANPVREIKVARAFLAVAMLRSGRSEAEVEAMLANITLKALRAAFELVPDTMADVVGSDAVDPSPPNRNPTTPGSSSGRTGKGGRPRKRASSASATSS